MIAESPAIILGESSETYHANPAIGSGKIRAFLRSSRLYRDKCDGLCDEESDALLFGIASHMRLLEPHLFATSVAIKPLDMSFATKEGKAWREDQGDRLIVKDEDAQHLTRMHERMPDEVRQIFGACQKEVTVRTTIAGLDVQCRPDLWDMKANRKYDLKTIGAIEDVERSIWKLGYHIQDGWYSHVIEAATKAKPPTSKLIFVEKAPPYRWRIVSLDPDYQMMARTAIGVALRGIALCMETGNWNENPDDLHVIASPPEWATEHLPLPPSDDE